MDLKIIENLLDPFIKENNLVYYGSSFEKEDGNFILRVLLDNEDNNIDINLLAKANEYLSNLIDNYDKDMPEYMLEVSSPGAERELRNDDEINKSLNKYIHVEVENMIYEGTLVESDNDSITIKVNLKGRFKNFKILKNEIKFIRLAVKF